MSQAQPSFVFTSLELSPASALQDKTDFCILVANLACSCYLQFCLGLQVEAGMQEIFNVFKHKLRSANSVITVSIVRRSMKKG